MADANEGEPIEHAFRDEPSNTVHKLGSDFEMSTMMLRIMDRLLTQMCLKPLEHGGIHTRCFTAACVECVRETEARSS